MLERKRQKARDFVEIEEIIEKENKILTDKDEDSRELTRELEAGTAVNSWSNIKPV